MGDEREVLIQLFDQFSRVRVHGPDLNGRVHVELGPQRLLDLGDVDTLPAQAALLWRSRRLTAWLELSGEPTIESGGRRRLH